MQKLPEVSTAQVLSYLKASGLKRALLINFGEKRLIDGVKRLSLCALWLSLFGCGRRPRYDYIAQDNPSAAERVVAGIYDKVQLLKEFPDIGYIYKSEPEGDIRVLLYGHYRIA